MESTRLLGRRKEEKRGNVFLFNDCEKKEHRASVTRDHLTVDGCLMQNILIPTVERVNIDKCEGWLKGQQNGR
jgi:hypothetical protein